uniref:Uncharacterized protein n=1 Tax=viral metagenome TaxID=1070528 RepID=A0A6C0EBN6_9ZZZZ
MSPYLVHLIKSPLYGSEIIKVLINQESSETVLKVHEELYSHFQSPEFKSEVTFEIKSINILDNNLINQFFQNLPKSDKLSEIKNFYKINDQNQLELLIEKTNSVIMDLENIQNQYITFESESDLDQDPDINEEPYHSDDESVSSFDMIDDSNNFNKNNRSITSVAGGLIRLVSKTLADAIGSGSSDKDEEKPNELCEQITPLFNTINSFTDSDPFLNSLMDPSLIELMNKNIKKSSSVNSSISSSPVSDINLDNIDMNNIDAVKNINSTVPNVLTRADDYLKGQSFGIESSTRLSTVEAYAKMQSERSSGSVEGEYNPNVSGTCSLEYMRSGYKFLKYSNYPDGNEELDGYFDTICKEEYKPLIYSTNSEKEYQVCLVKFKVDNRYLVLMNNDISEYIAKSELFPELQFETVYLIPNRGEVVDLFKIQMKLINNNFNSSEQLETIISKIKSFLEVSGLSNIVHIGVDQIKQDKIDRLIVKFINEKCLKTPATTGATTTSLAIKDAFNDYLNLIDMSLHIMVTFTQLKTWLSKYNYKQNDSGDYYLQLRDVKKFNLNNQTLNISSNFIVDNNHVGKNENKTDNISSILKLNSFSKLFKM